MKTILLCLLVAVGRVGAVTPEVVVAVESVPKVIGGLEFSVMSLKAWRPIEQQNELVTGVVNAFQMDGVMVQLRVTNRGTAAVTFPTFDTIRLGMKDGAGKTIRLWQGRDATRVTPSVLLNPGQCYLYPFSMRLLYLPKTGKLTLMAWDATGMQGLVESPAGDYTLFCQLLPGHGDAKAAEGSVLWSAEGTTEEVKVSVGR